MRIIQAAAVSYYFEDGLSCLSRKPAAVPITAEVREEAREAGQTRAGGRTEGMRSGRPDYFHIYLLRLLKRAERDILFFCGNALIH